jgi:hypothetical protein
MTTSEKRSQRRYQTDRIARRRLLSLPTDLRDQPVGRFRKWNMTCRCRICQITKKGNIELQRFRDQRRNSLPDKQ